MKKISILVLLVSIYLNVFGQNSIKVGNKVYYFGQVDSTKNRINGWWKVVGGEFFYDDDGTPSKEKWNGRDLGKRMFISDSLMTFYTPSFSEFYEKPKYQYEVFDMRDEEAGLFFKKFPPKILGINLYEFQDAKVWRGKDYAFSYYWFYFLSSNFIAFFKGSQVYYLERIIEEKDKYGWDEEEGFKIIKYTGFTSDITLNLEKEKYPYGSYFEVQFEPQKNCKKTWFKIATYPNYFTMGDEREFLIQHENILKKNNIIRIPIEKFQSNYITIDLGNCNSSEEWILKWRIIKKEVFKKIKYDKVILNSPPSQPTKIYLIRGDEVEIIEEKDNWLKIRYYGKKTIEGWIKKSDVE